jgi:hypothetical protein
MFGRHGLVVALIAATLAALGAGGYGMWKLRDDQAGHSDAIALPRWLSGREPASLSPGPVPSMADPRSATRAMPRAWS